MLLNIYGWKQLNKSFHVSGVLSNCTHQMQSVRVWMNWKKMKIAVYIKQDETGYDYELYRSSFVYI